MLPADVPLHLTARRGDVAERCLCPGDPDRARRAADELLDGARTVGRARGLAGFTGRYRGVPVTIQTTGMGGGSTAIVVSELLELGADALVRAGSCGGIQPDLRTGSMVVADAAAAADGAALALAGPGPHRADPGLTRALARAAERSGRPVTTGAIVSTDLFYDPEPGRPDRWRRAGRLAVEMEAATIFALAERAGASAGCALGVVNRLDDPAGGWLTGAASRELGLAVCRVGLEALVGHG